VAALVVGFGHLDVDMFGMEALLEWSDGVLPRQLLRQRRLHSPPTTQVLSSRSASADAHTHLSACGKKAHYE